MWGGFTEDEGANGVMEEGGGGFRGGERGGAEGGFYLLVGTPALTARSSPAPSIITEYPGFFGIYRALCCEAPQEAHSCSDALFHDGIAKKP